SEVARMISHEKANGYYDLPAYDKFRVRAYNIRQKLQEVLADIGPVAAIGACAKGVIILNWCGYNDTTRKAVKFIADDTPDKQGKFQPGTGIPIVPTSKLKGEDTVLILAWNWANEIMEKYPGHTFILPNPPHVVKG
ncbi:MAG: hypothetical protein ACXABY_33810, partial [Candidatus Thorarchaeota archaeon]